MSAEDLRQRAEKYDAMAVRHASVTYHDRRAFDSASVRYLNNFVKACMIDTACRTAATAARRGKAAPFPGLRLADIASGRGQDHSKWMYGASAAGTNIETYYGLDLGESDTAAAQTMAARCLKGVAVRIETGDMGVVSWGLGDASADVVTCQLA